ncbi:MAG TPA: hypothetical protein VHY91_16320 [Pirellulales bacterium]|nr:hypothetical protein [Pirellulales bacterium]
MNTKLKLIVAVALVGLVDAGTARAEALWLNRLVANAALDCGAPAPSCAALAPACCAPTISYNHVCVHRVRCCGCQPPIETALCVKDPGACNPCTAAPVIIPVCLPACCTGEPTVSGRVGLCGRGIVRYDYCCGLSIKIVFRNCGDIAVTYIGA